MNRLKWFAIGFFSVLVASLATLWFKRETVESDLIKRLIVKTSPSLPFTIESYKLAKNLNSLSLVFNFKGERIHVDGPLKWEWIKKDGIRLHYEPTVQIEGASSFSLLLTAQTEREWVHLYQFEFQIPPTDFQWKKYGIDAKHFSLSGSFLNQTLSTEFVASSIAWTDPSHSNHALNLADFQETSTGTNVDLSAKNAEVLWDQLYLDLPLDKLPLHFSIEEEKIIHLSLDSGLRKNSVIADAVLDAPLKEFQTAKINFQISPLPLSDLIPWSTQNLASILPALQKLSNYRFNNGFVSAKGSGDFQNARKKFSVKSLSLIGNSIHLRSVNQKLSVQGLDFDVNYSRREKNNLAHLEIQKIDFEHFSGKLSKTTIQWNENNLEVPGPLPFQIKDIPLSVGKIIATLKPEFSLETSLQLKSVSVVPIANGFCVDSNKIPPISLSGNFNPIQISKSEIDPTGKVEATLFDGKIDLTQLDFSDLDTEVPETDFDLDWSGIDLAKLNAWSNFGEVKGLLEGYAHDVVLQAMLPTEYHFLINVLPYHRSGVMARVEYSPEAMKNVVKLFTGANLDEQIPGVAGWLMFGWPSHFMGGYDVYYAGLKLNSEEGHIVVETLDKPEILESERKHFVLYGPRFKMPLTNSTYPLIVDATAMNNFVHQLETVLQAIKEKKEEDQHEEAKDIPCEAPEH